jgi:hypothetical protein
VDWGRCRRPHRSLFASLARLVAGVAFEVVMRLPWAHDWIDDAPCRGRLVHAFKRMCTPLSRTPIDTKLSSVPTKKLVSLVCRLARFLFDHAADKSAKKCAVPCRRTPTTESRPTFIFDSSAARRLTCCANAGEFHLMSRPMSRTDRWCITSRKRGGKGGPRSKKLGKLTAN